MNILVGYLSLKYEMNIFLKCGNKSLHEISKDNDVVAVNYNTGTIM